MPRHNFPKAGDSQVARVPLEQFPQRDWLRRWKNRLALALPILALALLLLSLWRSDGGQALTTPRAPVSSVHATWDANCTACHEPFTPIQNTSWTAPLFAHSPVTNEKCQTCHAGPVHHRTQTTEMNCTACHREHRGRQASLVRIPDSDCTGCHRNLVNHFAGPKEHLVFGNVSRFAQGEHPEFKMKGSPGNLRFNHQLHLTAGLPGKVGSKRKLTLGELSAGDRERYQKQQADRRPDALVQLTCASCHVTDASDLGHDRTRLSDLPVAALLPPRRAGDAMVPIIFENQCRACHPLTFEPGDGKFRGDGPAVPHRLQPPQVRVFLEGFYSQQAFHSKADAFQLFVPTRPLPGKLLEEPATRRLQAWIDKKVRNAGQQLFHSQQTCGQCHLPVESKTPQVGPFPPALKPTQLPDIWMPHAIFSHQAHRALDCLQCHPLVSRSENPPMVFADMGLPNLKKCLECHSPQRVQTGVPVGGARFDCVECHRYHHGDAPLQGLGAARRGVPTESRLSLQEFLSGRPKR